MRFIDDNQKRKAVEGGRTLTIDPLSNPIILKKAADDIKQVWRNIHQNFKDNLQAEKAFDEYDSKYRQKYGKIKLLGMSEPIPLQDIYTAVQFLNKLSLSRFLSLESLEASYRESLQRRFQVGIERGDRDDISVAKKYPRLMVLGGPGSGKSTYLKRLGLEALNGKAGAFKDALTPVFLELKHFKSDEINLKTAIAEELGSVGFPLSETFVTKLLEEGKLLVLLDGLDEVPRANINDCIDAIEAFVVQYEQNRFVASCRTAAYKRSCQSFTDVELANFDDKQIEQFIQNWFCSEPDTAQQCWEALNQPDRKAAKELAQTPLLLTSLCQVYEDDKSFPLNRNGLYRRPLDILLEKWESQKGVLREQIYQRFHAELEKVLLSEIAYHGFVADQIFFPQQQLVDQIRAFLADGVDNPKYLDAKAVLNAIAMQQGILAERAADIFSFSHLTLQEYLTAEYIDAHHLTKELVTEHLTDVRWREVFLLIAGGMRGGADELLLQMEKQAQKYINLPKLQALLFWAEQITASSDAKYNSITKRAMALIVVFSFSRTLSLSPALSRVLNLDCILDLNRILFGAFFRVFDFDCSPDSALTHPLYRFLYSAISSALDLDRVLDLDFALKLCVALAETKIFQGVDWKMLMSQLDEMARELSNSDRLNEKPKDFVEQFHQVWCDALHLERSRIELSGQYLTAITDYLYANELIVACKETAIQVSQKTWYEIQGRMLLPVESLEGRTET